MSGLLMGLVWGREIAGHPRDVLLAMADHAHDDGSSCYPSVPKLAWKVGISERTVQRIIGQMMESGVLELVAAARRHRPSEYAINLSALPAKAAFRGDRGDRGDNLGVTGVTNQGFRGDIHGVTLTVENRPIKPTTGAPPAEHVTADIAQTAAPKRVRVPSPWSAFRTTVLDSYGQASNKGTQSLATRIIQTAEHHGLEPEDAARAWQRWRTATTEDDTARYWPIHRAAEGWGAWLQERRASARPMPIRAAAMDRVESREVTA